MKTRSVLVAIAALALSACSGGGSNPPAPANNPSSIAVTTEVQGVATSGISVTLSTALSGNPPSTPSGTIVQTLTSDASGNVVFDTGIPTTGRLCLSSTYTVGTQSQTLASCHGQPHPPSATINFDI